MTYLRSEWPALDRDPLIDLAAIHIRQAANLTDNQLCAYIDAPQGRINIEVRPLVAVRRHRATRRG